MTAAAPVRETQSRAERIAHTPQFEWMARAGLVALGSVYVVVGVLALKLALGDGGEATSQQGALQTIAQQPLGKVLLVLVAVGLTGYAFWRLLRAAIGRGPEAADDTQDRLAGLVSGIANGALVVTAIKVLIGSGAGNSNAQADKTTGGVLGWPGGTVLVAVTGAVIIGVGLAQGYKAVRREFLEDSKTGEMSPQVRKGFTTLGVVGYSARMVVFALIGYFLIRAALNYDPDKAVALDGALAHLGQAPYGPVLLGIVAAGLLCFGTYSIIDARFRKV